MMDARTLLPVIAGAALLLGGAATVTAEGHNGTEDDPFADDRPLFEDDEDPFAEYEERATVEDDEDDEVEASQSEEEENALPVPIGAALVGIAVAAVGFARKPS